MKKENLNDLITTYIIQIFGTLALLEIWSECVSNKNNLMFCTEDCIIQGSHWFLIGKDKYRYDSRNYLQQDYDDNLCQSYALALFNNVILSTRRPRQNILDIINMYRNMLNNEMFLKKLNNECLSLKENKKMWFIYKNDKKTKPINMNIYTIKKNILKVLKLWEKKPKLPCDL